MKNVTLSQDIVNWTTGIHLVFWILSNFLPLKNIVWKKSQYFLDEWADKEELQIYF